MGRWQCHHQRRRTPASSAARSREAGSFLSGMLNLSPQDSPAIGSFYPINAKYKKPSVLIY